MQEAKSNKSTSKGEVKRALAKYNLKEDSNSTRSSTLMQQMQNADFTTTAVCDYQ